MAEFAVLSPDQVRELAAEGYREGYRQCLADARKSAARGARTPDRATIKEAMEITRYSRRTLGRMVAAGTIRSIKLGTGKRSKVFFFREDLEKLVAEARS